MGGIASTQAACSRLAIGGMARHSPNARAAATATVSAKTRPTPKLVTAGQQYVLSRDSSTRSPTVVSRELEDKLKRKDLDTDSRPRCPILV